MARKSANHKDDPKIPADWLPKFEEAEKWVLSTLLNYPDYPIPVEQENALGDKRQEPIAVVDAYRSWLSPDVFKVPNHRRIAQTAWDLMNGDPPRTPDYFAVLDQLHRDGLIDDIGGAPTLTDIVRNPVLPARAQEYADALRAMDERYRVFMLSSKLAQLAFRPPETGGSLLVQVQTLVEGLGQPDARASYQLVSELGALISEQVEYRRTHPDERTSLHTGFTDLTEYLGGWNPSELILLAARPGIGKTSFALSSIAQVAKTAPVLIFSLEMSNEQVAQRLLAIDASIDGAAFKRPTTENPNAYDLRDSVERYRETYHPIYVSDKSGVTFGDIRTTARQVLREIERAGGAGTPKLFIVIDYLQLIDTSDLTRDGNRVQELSALTRRLKTLARELNVPILALSQLSRDIEKRQSHRPMLSDLRDSGSLEQDADVVLFIHRPDVYEDAAQAQNPAVQNEQRAAGQAIDADVIIAKNRNGALATVQMRFFPQFTRYELAPDTKGRNAVGEGLPLDMGF